MPNMAPYKLPTSNVTTRVAPRTLRASATIQAFTKKQEDLRLRPYKGADETWTVGWGHTTHVAPTDEITVVQAERYFDLDTGTAENGIWENVTVDLAQQEFDALWDFVWNVGAQAFHTSTVLRKLNAKDYLHVPNYMTSWDKIKGVYSQDLYNRRIAEGRIFLMAQY